MMSGFKRILGIAWAAPVTAVGAIYAGLFKLLGWYSWGGVHGDAFVFVVNFNKSPGWLQRAWRGWGGHTIGNVVVMTQTPQEKPGTLIHESKHVDQCMRLGIFHPIMYGLNMLAIKIGCPGSNMYFDNPFEIDARRHAGEIVDVVGTMNKLKGGR